MTTQQEMVLDEMSKQLKNKIKNNELENNKGHIKIFVYGTLKKGFKNNYLLKNAIFLQNYITTKTYPMIDSGFGFPYLLNKPGIGKQIQGEIYEISKDLKKDLDILEDVPRLYYLDDIEEFKTYFVIEKISLDNKEFLSKW